MTNNLPGEQEARSFGYVCYCHAGNKSSATYHKDRMSLTVWKNGEGELFSMHKFIRLTTGKFSFPNKNFRIFERTLRECLPKLD